MQIAEYNIQSIWVCPVCSWVNLLNYDISDDDSIFCEDCKSEFRPVLATDK